MTEKELTFLEKLSHLITELKVPKSQRNNFGKYNYRSAEDILEAVKPIAYQYGLVPKLSDKPVMIGDWHYMQATASIQDVKTGEEEIATAYAREPLAKKGMDESQITGTASSYARKYAMDGLYQIDDTKDADTDEYTEQIKQATPKKSSKAQQESLQNRAYEPPKLVDGKQVAKLKDEARQIADLTGNTPDMFLDKLAEMAKVESIEYINQSSYGGALSQLVKWKQGYQKQVEEKKQTEQSNEVNWGQA